MNAYKFDVTVGQDGSIHLPYLSELENQDVEVIIVPGYDREKHVKQDNAGVDFVNTWSGILSEEIDPNSRLEFISEKYK